MTTKLVNLLFTEQAFVTSIDEIKSRSLGALFRFLDCLFSHLLLTSIFSPSTNTRTFDFCTYNVDRVYVGKINSMETLFCCELENDLSTSHVVKEV